ncbi:MAG: hypothetical protein Q9M36_11890 [Sulfurovum sp.]|nr:hypothetical protein [Sulfurovum sp.]
MQDSTEAQSREAEGITGFSLKALFLILVASVLLGFYVKVLIFGENSFTVLADLRDKKSGLEAQQKVLKIENQVLQKAFFELKQLVPKE